MTAGTTEVRCRLFVGTRGGDTITLACLEDESYVVLRNDEPVGFWGADAMEACIEAYLGMLDRPAPAGDDGRAAFGAHAGTAQEPVSHSTSLEASTGF